MKLNRFDLYRRNFADSMIVKDWGCLTAYAELIRDAERSGNLTKGTFKTMIDTILYYPKSHKSTWTI